MKIVYRKKFLKELSKIPKGTNNQITLCTLPAMLARQTGGEKNEIYGSLERKEFQNGFVDH